MQLQIKSNTYWIFQFRSLRNSCSSNTATCRIIPKVEYAATDTLVTPNDWQVAGIKRADAQTVLFFDASPPNPMNPAYDGTPSDDTVIAIISHLLQFGIKIMLYQMIFVDEIFPKPNSTAVESY